MVCYAISLAEECTPLEWEGGGGGVKWGHDGRTDGRRGGREREGGGSEEGREEEREEG